MSLRQAVTIALISCLGAGCETTPPGSTPSTPIFASDAATDYESLIEYYSGGDKQYNGFYNLFAYKATIENSAVIDALIHRQADSYKWEESKIATERANRMRLAETETEVHVTFYTPDRHNDNLADAKAIWRVFLDCGGKRYIGKVKKSKMLLAETVSLFPYHSRWTTSYNVIFPVGIASLQNQESILTVTGPLGSRVANFKALTTGPIPQAESYSQPE